MNTDLMFSKKSDEWVTPQDLYDRLDLEFRFECDAAATKANAKTGQYWYFGPDHLYADRRDALAIHWVDAGRRRFWLNPPYSQCRAFIAKAAAEAKHGALVVALLPARTDTRWFHDDIWDGANHHARARVEIRFLKGRLKFAATGEVAKNSAPFPSMVVIFWPHEGRA